MTPPWSILTPDSATGDKARAIYAIWKDLAGERFAPRRQDITLPQVSKLSPWLWLIDVMDGGRDFRFRLAGDRIVQFLGGRHQGMRLSELPLNPFFVRMRHTLVHCVEHKKPIALGPVETGYPGKEHWAMEVVVLPLSDDGETVDCMLGTMELWPLHTKQCARAAP